MFSASIILFHRKTRFNHLKQKKELALQLCLIIDSGTCLAFLTIKPDVSRHLSLVVFYSQLLKMLGRKLFHFLIILLVCAVLKHGNHKCRRHKSRSVKSSRQPRQNFHEVDAYGDDFIDFGASTGRHGQFSWHASYPLERW